MLKKAGIVVAATSAGLLAISPLAFAQGHRHHDNDGNDQRALIGLQNTNLSIPVQACNDSIIEGVLGVLAKDQRNSDSHKGRCDLDNRVRN